MAQRTRRQGHADGGGAHAKQRNQKAKQRHCAVSAPLHPRPRPAPLRLRPLHPRALHAARACCLLVGRALLSPPPLQHARAQRKKVEVQPPPVPTRMQPQPARQPVC